METTGHVGSAPDSAVRLLQNVETVVRGKTEEIRLVLTALVCGGHVLLEDSRDGQDGAARAIAGSVDGAAFSRIQCTPDLQPTDVTGLSVFNQRDRDFEFRAGPVFANVLLVDEINRAMPKTQSALLEAMAEQQVTIDGVTRELPEPFLVLATENPIEQEGTFPLPEAQLDRFFLQNGARLPVARRGGDHRGAAPCPSVRQLRPVLSAAEVQAPGGGRGRLHRPVIRRWVIELVRATRAARWRRDWRIGPRSLALERAARAWALLRGREDVTPVDVEVIFCRHPTASCSAPSFAATRARVGLDGRAAAPPARPERASTAAPPRPSRRGPQPAARRRRCSPPSRRRRSRLRSGPARACGRGLAPRTSPVRRPHQPGDDVDKIDWYASARLSLARARGAPSSASTSPTKRCASSCSATGDRPCRSSRRAGPAVEAGGDSERRPLIGAKRHGGARAAWILRRGRRASVLAPPRSSHTDGAPRARARLRAPEEPCSEGCATCRTQARPACRHLPASIAVGLPRRTDRDQWLDTLERRFEIVPVIVQDPDLGAELPGRERRGRPVWSAPGRASGGLPPPCTDEKPGAPRCERGPVELSTTWISGPRPDPVVVDSHESRDALCAPARAHQRMSRGDRHEACARRSVHRRPRGLWRATLRQLLAAGKIAAVRGSLTPEVHLFGEPWSPASTSSSIATRWIPPTSS